jgi:hypothetical protein
VINVESLKLYEPPMIMDEEESIQISTVDDFSPEYLDKLQEDVILYKIIRTSERGDVENIRFGLKGVKASKEKWIEIEKVRDIYAHLVSKK